jgi:hypothetical protein
MSGLEPGKAGLDRGVVVLEVWARLEQKGRGPGLWGNWVTAPKGSYTGTVK